MAPRNQLTVMRREKAARSTCPKCGAKPHTCCVAMTTIGGPPMIGRYHKERFLGSEKESKR